MKFPQQSFLRLLNICIALALGAVIVACLDIPDSPDTSQRVTSIKVYSIQYGITDSTLLKVNPRDTARLVAIATPIESEKDLRFFWFNEGYFLDSGAAVTIDVNEPKFVPDQLVAVDPSGHFQEVKVQVIANAPPTLRSKSEPADGEVIYASRTTPITFRWYAEDVEDDDLENILEIDSKSYSVGNLNQIKQSGFKPGKHTYRVIVRDIYGEADSLPQKKFFVVDTTEANR